MMRIFLLTLLLAFHVGAEEPNTHETEEQTITKCLADLNNENPDVRHRAVLILGKYRAPHARAAVVRALADADAKIRRSALVALTEKAVPLSACDKVLAMIGDSDVHIRRIASSYVPNMMGQLRMLMHPSRPNILPQKAKRAIVSGFRDEDATVRRNMVAAFPQLRNVVPPNVIVGLLHDPDREVRVMALKSYAGGTQPSLFTKNVAHLVNDSDNKIRFQLAQLLNRPSYRLPGTKLLQTLSQDEDFEISTAALVGLFSIPDFQHYEAIRKRFDDHRFKPEVARRVIHMLAGMGERGRDALLELSAHPSATYRQVAILAYGNRYYKTLNINRFLPYLADPSSAVREAAATVLQRCQVPAGEAEALIDSEFPDVRRLCVALSRRFKDEEAEPLLLDLLLDDAADVRTEAIGEIASRQLGDWQAVIIQTYTDDDPKIQKHVTDVIAKMKDPQRTAVFSQVLLSEGRAEAKKRIVSRLTSMRFKPAPDVAIALLKAPEAEIRQLGLQASEMVLVPKDFVAHTQALATDEDPLLRQQLTQILSNPRYQDTESLLKQLAEDSNFVVSAGARTALFTRGAHGYFQALTAQLNDPRMPEDVARLFILSAPNAGAAGTELLGKLLKHPKAAFRQAALQAMRRHPKAASVESILTALNDDDRAVRQAAGRILLRQQLDVNAIRQVVGNAHPDVRQLAFNFIPRIKNSDAGLLLLKLYRDDTTFISSRAAAMLIQRQLPGWEDVWQTVFSTQDIGRQTTVIRLLLQAPNATILERLERLQRTTNSQAIKQLIMGRLKAITPPAVRRR